MFVGPNSYTHTLIHTIFGPRLSVFKFLFAPKLNYCLILNPIMHNRCHSLCMNFSLIQYIPLITYTLIYIYIHICIYAW